VILTLSVLGSEHGYSQSILSPSKLYFLMNYEMEAMKTALFSAFLTAAEKKDDGKVHPPIAAITFKSDFCDLYFIIVAISLSSLGSMVVNSKGALSEQSVEYQ